MATSVLPNNIFSTPHTDDVTADDIDSLGTIFNDGLDLYNDLCINNEQATNSLEAQVKVKNAMRLLEKATRLVSLAGVFSRNEGIEEVATNDLQYFLLPALLGSLALKLTTGDRREIVEVADVYFKDFLQRCKDYNLSDYEHKTKEEPVNENEYARIAYLISTRAYKIKRFNQQKELKEKLADLKKNMENEHADEEIKRNYFLTMIQLFIHEAIDELHSIDMEKPLLDHKDELLKNEPQPRPKPKRRPAPPLKPIIITKDEVQKAVYGAGYPALPTMTVQEFYDKRVKDGVFPDPNKQPSTSNLSLQQKALRGLNIDEQDEKETEEKEKKVDEDDPEYLERMRNLDEYKDEHRRGWGNRMNRS